MNAAGALGPIAVVGVGVAAATIFAGNEDSMRAVLRKAKTYATNCNLYVQSLSPMSERTGRVEKGQAEFFALDINQHQCDNGLVFICRSPDKSAFKLILFDERGELVAVQASVQRNQQFTQVKMVSLPFEHMLYHPQQPALNALPNCVLSRIMSAPPVFFELDRFVTTTSKLKPGRYLLAVYGNNWIEPTPFKVKWVVANFTGRQELVKAIKQAEEKINNKRRYMDNEMAQQYNRAKAEYERVLTRLKEEERNINDLKTKWAAVYENFLNTAESNARFGAGSGSSNMSKSPIDYDFDCPPSYYE